MPFRREIAVVLAPAVLLIGSLVVFSCVRDAIALADPSPIIATPPAQR